MAQAQAVLDQNLEGKLEGQRGGRHDGARRQNRISTLRISSVVVMKDGAV